MEQPQPTPWVRAENLTFGYGVGDVFQELSFSIGSEMVALQGPSGSGKTTLLKLINGDLTPRRGHITLSGASTILILQDDSLLPWLTGEQNISISSTFRSERIFDPAILEGMAGFSAKRAHEMSFGQRRYLEIVRALGSEADVLLLDEPLNFLDVERRAMVIKELLRQAKHRRIMMSTHYVEDFDGAPVGRVQLVGEPPYREVAIV